MTNSDKITAISRAFVTMFQKGEFSIPSDADRDSARRDLMARIETMIGASVSEEEFDETMNIAADLLERIQQLRRNSRVEGAEMIQRTVAVWGERYDPAVSQDANGLWVATGAYKGQKVEVKDKTEAAALQHWQTAARAKGP